MSVSVARAQELFEEEIIKALEANLPIAENLLGSPTLNFSRTRKTLGDCKWKWDNYSKQTKKDVVIRVSQYLLDTDERMVRATIAHELCHACPGDGHGTLWKKWAKMFDDMYHYGITRLANHEDTETFVQASGLREEREKRKKYEVQCPICKHIWTRSRMCYVVEHPEFCSCKECHHTLIRIK